MKKCNLPFFAIIVLAISLFFTSCSKQNGSVVPESEHPVLFNQAASDTTVVIPTVSAVKVKHMYKMCGSDSSKTVDRYKAVNDTISVTYTGQGTKFDFAAWLKGIGAQLVYSDKASAAPVVTPTPVDPSNGGKSSAKKSSKREPWDFSLGGDILQLLFWIIVIALALLLGLWLLLQAWRAIQRSRDNTNNGGGGNGNRDAVINQERTVNTSRNGGGNAYRGPGPNIKSRTIVIETKETISETY